MKIRRIMHKNKSILLALLLAGIFLLLLSGTVRTIFFPKEINSYEVRPANKMMELSLTSFLSGQYQSSFESALSDQIPLSQYLKKIYNDTSSSFMEPGINAYMNKNPDSVLRYNGMNIYRDHLIFDMHNFEEIKADYDHIIQGCNGVIAANPQTEFVFYYIESDYCCDVIGGAKNPSYDYLSSQINVDKSSFGRFEINNFEDFSLYFRKTDHHWNHIGSYKAYTHIASLLGIEEELMQPAEKRVLAGVHSGFKAFTAKLQSVSEKTEVYFFDYPEYSTQYGNEDAYRSGELADFVYAEFYGDDEPELVFDTNNPGKENLLVVGDSYDNAILKLLASHYNRTHAIDLRYYIDENGGKGLDFTEYINKHEIDKVLFIGSDFLYGDSSLIIRS